MSDIFTNAVIELSNSKVFENARTEWDVNFSHRSDDGTNCVCGQRIKNVYSITNKLNGNQIPEVGCECIEKVGGELKEALKKVVHKQDPKNSHLYCEWCGDRHRNRRPICNLCKQGDYPVGFGKYRGHTLNYIYKKNPGWFTFVEQKATHRYCGRVAKFHRLKKTKRVSST